MGVHYTWQNTVNVKISHLHRLGDSMLYQFCQKVIYGFLICIPIQDLQPQNKQKQNGEQHNRYLIKGLM